MHWLETVSNVHVLVKMSWLRCFCCVMKFLMPSVVKFSCKRCIGWKQQLKIFLSLFKMSCLCCFRCSIKFLMPSVVKLGC